MQKTIDGLTEQSKNISSVDFSNVQSISTERKLILDRLKTEITSNIDSLISKSGLGQDVSKELELYNSPRISNATDYFLNYKANLELIQSVFLKGGGPTLTIGGIENQSTYTASFRSSSKIYSAITKEIYRALMEDLNSADPGSWNENSFILTFGSSENFRHYIDKRCADIAALESANTKSLQNIGANISNTSVLEDLYLMISSKEPVVPLAEGDVKVEDFAHVSSKYLVSSYLFGLEVIKHNQLLYAPPVSEATAIDVDDSKINQVIPVTPKVPFTAVPDVSRVAGYDANQPEVSSEKQPVPIQTVPEASFEAKYDPSLIQKVATELNSKNEADYFTPYMKLLSSTEAIVGDYACKTSNFLIVHRMAHIR